MATLGGGTLYINIKNPVSAEVQKVEFDFQRIPLLSISRQPVEIGDDDVFSWYRQLGEYHLIIKQAGGTVDGVLFEDARHPQTVLVYAKDRRGELLFRLKLTPVSERA